MRLTRGLLVAAAALLVALTTCVVGPSIAVAAPKFETEAVSDTTLPGSSIAELRAGLQEGYDRVIFEFEGEVASYVIGYVAQVVEDGTGEAVSLEGAAFIQVDLINVPDEPRAPQGTVTPELPAIVQIVGAGAGLDNTAHYGIGTPEAAGFRVLTLTEPSRLVIDIAHPEAAADPEATPTPTEDAAAGPSPPQFTPAGRLERPDSPYGWLIYLVGGLAVVVLAASIIGWRLSRPR